MVKSALLTFVFLHFSVAVQSFVITYSTPQQCGGVEIAWSKPSPSAAQLSFPLQLQILPFDSTAKSKQIDGWNASMTSGSTIVRFNLTSGTKFLLAVTDKTGTGAGTVSDVMTINDTLCPSTQSHGDPHGHFQVFTTPQNSSDCPSLNVQWDGTVESSRPTIIAFSPGQHPVNMDPAPSLPMERSVVANGTFTSMSKVVVLFRDDDTSGRTSQFLTVGGTDKAGCSCPVNSTSHGCSPSVSTMSVYTAPWSPSYGATKVLAGTAAAVVGLAILLYVLLAYHRRQLRRTTQGPIHDSQVLSTKLGTPPSPSRQSRTSDSGSISPTGGAKSPARSDEVGVQVPEPEKDVTNPPSAILSIPTPIPTTTTPLQRRRSWAQDSSNSIQFAEASGFKPVRFSQSTNGDSSLQFSVGESRSPTILFLDVATRPDSPTLPELRMSPFFSAFAQPPSSPRSARSRSLRSFRTQRSDKRECYVMNDPTIIDAPRVSKGTSTYSPRSPSIRMNRASRTQKMQ